MKRAFVILGILLAGAIVALILMRGAQAGAEPQWQPKPQLTFLGFINANPAPPFRMRVGPSNAPIPLLPAVSPVTNANAQPAISALFGIKNVPREETVWRVIEVSHRENGEWKAWEKPASSAFAWYNPAPTNFDLGATVPVRTTNVPLRIVMELNRQPTGGPLRFLGVLWDQLNGRNTVAPRRVTAASFLITNEINVVGGTSSTSP